MPGYLIFEDETSTTYGPRADRPVKAFLAVPNQAALLLNLHPGEAYIEDPGWGINVYIKWSGNKWVAAREPSTGTKPKTFNVIEIIPTTSTTAGKIVIEGDFTDVFTGNFYLNEDTNTHYPFFEDAPANTVKVEATQFKLTNNTKFSGRYSVRTPRDGTPEERDRYLENGNTVIQVNELIRPLGDSEDDTPLTEGTISNISTFIIETPDQTIKIYPKTLSKVLYLDLPGHGYENWGELYTQNFVDMMFNHATTVEPRDARTGQLWFDLSKQQLKIWAGDQWVITTPAPPKPMSYLHSQDTPADTWVANHQLNIAFPHIANIQVYVDRGYGLEPVAPNKITFNNSNELMVQFSEPLKGYIKINI